MPGQSYSYTEPTPRGEVRFVLPGAKQKEGGMCPRPRYVLVHRSLISHIVLEITPFNSTDTPQPFIDPDIIERWRRERGRGN